MYHMGHVTKFLLIFRNNLRPHEMRCRFQILGNEIKVMKVSLYCLNIFLFYNYTNFGQSKHSLVPFIY